MSGAQFFKDVVKQVISDPNLERALQMMKAADEIASRTFTYTDVCPNCGIWLKLGKSVLYCNSNNEVLSCGRSFCSTEHIYRCSICRGLCCSSRNCIRTCAKLGCVKTGCTRCIRTCHDSFNDYCVKHCI